PAPRLEPDHAIRVEQEQRRAVHPERFRQTVERELVDLLEVARTRHGLRELVQHTQLAELRRRHGPGPGPLRLAESLLVSRPGSLVIRLPRQAHDPNPAVAVPRPGSPGEPRPTGAPHVPYPAATRRPARGHNARPSTTSTAPQSYARARVRARCQSSAVRPRPPVAPPRPGGGAGRSEERRVGKECRTGWSPYH